MILVYALPSMITASEVEQDTTLLKSSGDVGRNDSESSVNFSGLSRSENIKKLKFFIQITDF